MEKIIMGEHGSAQLVTKMPPSPARLGAWFLTFPKAHLFWHNYSLALIHLRDVPGVPSAKKGQPEAEYEVSLYALDRDAKPTAINFTEWVFLRPANVIAQFHGVNDEQALEILEELAEDCVEGKVFMEPSGITGAREMWWARVEMRVEQKRKTP